MRSLNPLPKPAVENLDKSKLLAFADTLDKIEVPPVVSAEAIVIIRDAHESLEYLAKAIRIKAEAL